MKTPTNLLKIASTVGLTALTAFSAHAIETLNPQFLSGTISTTAGTYGNYTIDTVAVQGVLSPLTISGTITTEGDEVEKSTGTGNKTVTTTTGKSSVAKITNAEILNLVLGGSVKGSTLGYFTNLDGDQTPVVVQKSGTSVTLTSIDDEFLKITGSDDDEVTINLTMKTGNGKDDGDYLASLSQQSNEFMTVTIGVETYSLSGLAKNVYTAKNGVEIKSFNLSAFGIKSGLALPTVPILDVKDFDVKIGAQILEPQDANLGNPVLVTSRVWKATGLPSGLTINSSTGVITGKVLSGVPATIYSVTISVTTDYGTDTDEINLSLVDK